MITHLTKFVDLGSSRRIEPSQEYPGSYTVYVNGEEHATFRDSETSGAISAKDAATQAVKTMRRFGDDRITVSWSADENDPRIGKVWFTSHYRLDV